MLAFISLIGIFLSIILLFFNIRNNRASVYLSLFFFSITTYSLIYYVILYSKSVILVSIFFINMGFLTYLIGPMLFLYTRSILSDDSRLKKIDIWHFIPMIIFMILELPHLSSSWSQKIEIARYIIEKSNNIISYNEIYFHGKIIDSIIFMSRPIFAIIYLLSSITLLIKYLKRKEKLKVLSHQAFMVKWLAVLYVFLFVLIVSHSSQLIISHINRDVNVFYSLNILQWFSGIGLFGLLFSPFIFPNILYGLPHVPENMPVGITVDQAKGKRPLGLEIEYLDIIERIIESTMSKAKPYIHTECNLNYFAKIAKIPVHHLAYYFREVKKQSFNEYRNLWRVKHAKELLRQGKNRDYTIEAIGMLSGFSSKNTFFMAFKKFEGITPGTYAKQTKFYS